MPKANAWIDRKGETRKSALPALRAWVAEAGIEAVAAALFVTGQSVRNWVRGALPSYQTAKAILDFRLNK